MTKPGVQQRAAAEVLVRLEEGPEAEGSDHYRAVFDALEEGLCILEVISSQDQPSDYRFVEVNDAFERATGLENVTGATYRELMPPVSILAPESYDRIARTGVAERFVTDSEAPGGARRFDVYAFRLGDEPSRRVAVHFTDVSERTLTEQELQDRTAQFSSLIAQAPLGVFLVDAAFRLVLVNPVAEEVFRAIPDLLERDFEDVMRLVWREGLAVDVIAAFRQTLETGAPSRHEDLATDHGEHGVSAYYDWRIDRVLMPDGQFGVVCYFSNVSPLVEARRALAASDEQYRAVFETMDQGFCIVQVIYDDSERPVDYRYVEVNGVFEERMHRRDVRGRTMRDLGTHRGDFWVDVYGAIASTGVARRFLDFAEASDRWCDVSAVRIGDPDERKVATLFHDVTERKRAERKLLQSVMQLRHRAHHDPLTGLPNRIVFEERLQLALAEAARYTRAVAVMFIDLDGFKAINDTLGHACGDVVLKETAQRLKRALRTTDTLARMHGDEFVVLVPQLDEAHDVEVLAGKMLAAVAVPVEVDGTSVVVSASIGVSIYPDHASTPDALLHAADAAMYRAKASGRNTVTIASASSKARPNGSAGSC